jgi:transcriptional regulator with XRE-family HTH domain
MENVELGRQLQQLRRRRKLSLRALSRSTGVALSFLSAVEQGKNNVSVAKLKTILDSLGVSLSEFFQRELTATEGRISEERIDRDWSKRNGNFVSGSSCRATWQGPATDRGAL